MIIFLNFTPFNFGGGAERWMFDVSSVVHKREETYLIDVDRSIANIYGTVILKRTYTQRLDSKKKTAVETQTHISLSFRSCIPFTSQWHGARSALQKARLIYIRYEVVEVAILLCIGGLSMFQKTIAGIHSPFIYKHPLTFLDNLHNFIYTSSISTWCLSHMKNVHAINPQDYKMFREKLGLKNVTYIPNFIDMKNNENIKSKKTDTNNLNIAFIGELNIRKGVDILIDTIKRSPKNYIFHIAGDGPLREDIERLTFFENVRYYGYLDRQALVQLYNDCDLLFVPSRAESFSLAVLEGMSHGLPFISSNDIRIGLPASIQIINKTGTVKEYITILGKIFEMKKSGGLVHEKKEIQTYTKNNFSRDRILPQLLNEIFEIGKQ